MYFCEENKVDESFYNYAMLVNQANQNTTINCVKQTRLKFACLCPKDFYGPQCEFWNTVLCNMTKDENENCP